MIVACEIEANLFKEGVLETDVFFKAGTGNYNL